MILEWSPTWRNQSKAPDPAIERPSGFGQGRPTRGSEFTCICHDYFSRGNSQNFFSIEKIGHSPHLMMRNVLQVILKTSKLSSLAQQKAKRLCLLKVLLCWSKKTLWDFWKNCYLIVGYGLCKNRYGLENHARLRNFLREGVRKYNQYFLLKVEWCWNTTQVLLLFIFSVCLGGWNILNTLPSEPE